MAKPEGLQAAMTSFGAALIEALPALEAPQPSCSWHPSQPATASSLGLSTDTKHDLQRSLQKGANCVGAEPSAMLKPDLIKRCGIVW